LLNKSIEIQRETINDDAFFKEPEADFDEFNDNVDAKCSDGSEDGEDKMSKSHMIEFRNLKKYHTFCQA
jgi:hypothetical protein